MKVLAPARAASRAPLHRRVPAARSGITRTSAARTSMFVAMGAQPALTVGAVNDPLEREAEVNAERIASGGRAEVAGADAASPRGPPASDRGQPLRREGLDGQPDTSELEQTPAMPENLVEPVVPPQADVDPEGLDAADMAEIETGGEGGDTGAESTGGEGDETPAPESPAEDAPADEPVQTDRAGMPAIAVGPEGGAAPPDVSGRVASPGAGRPLPGGIRAAMERGFAADFGHVRIHDRDGDRRDAMRLGARAFTHGRHIWLGPGESASDRRLMAHELTHVVQQTGRRPQVAATSRDVVPRASPAPIRRGWIADKAESYARHIPGYPLLTVLLGESPITGEKIPRTAENLVGGFMSLAPGGEFLFEQLQKAGVVREALDWVNGKLDELDLSWGRIGRAIDKAISDFSIRSPIESIKPAFRPLLHDIISFAIAIKDKIVELIIKGALKLAGGFGQRVWDVVNGAGVALKLILEDPLGFAKNLVASVVRGFGQFRDRILEHLQRGLMGWLFGAIEGADLKMPAKLDLKGLMSIGFQLLGLTWGSIRKKLVKKLGPSGEKQVSFLEQSVDVISILVKEGFAGIWQRMLEYVDNFRQTVIGGIRNFVITTIVTNALAKLAMLSNPVGAIIQLAMAIYRIIVVFIERFKQIEQVALSLFASIGEIAAGNITAAANKVEETIGNTVPVVISFLAGFFGLGGISGHIRKTIRNLKEPVDKALEKLIGFLVKKAKNLFSKVIAKLNKKRKPPSVPFVFGQGQHEIFARTKGKKVEVMIASEKGKNLSTAEKEAAEQARLAKDAQANAAGVTVPTAVKKANKATGKTAANVEPASQKVNQRKPLGQLEDELKKVGEDLKAKGVTIDEFPEFDTTTGHQLFRAREPRFESIEGKAGKYKDRGSDTAKQIEVNGVPKQKGKTYSLYYENDHIPEKQYAHAILKNLAKFKPGGGAVLNRGESEGAPPAPQAATEPTVGKLGKSIKAPLDDDAKEFPAITIYRPVHLGKKTTQPADVDRKVVEAGNALATGPGPVGAVKNMIKAAISDESSNVASIVRKDQTAEPKIRANVDSGLAKVAEMGRETYGLNETPKVKIDPTEPVSSLSDVPFTGDKSAGKPDFTKMEGTYEPYKPNGTGFGKYVEQDHIIGSAWAMKAKDLRFGDEGLKEKIEAELIKVPGARKPKVELQLKKLENTRVFARGHKLLGYEHDSGKSITVYRPIHRMVTVDERAKAPSDVTDITEGIGKSFVTHMAQYAKSDDESDLDEARREVQGDVKKILVRATQRHTDVVAEHYLGELQQAAETNPERKDDATKAMRKIAARVKDSLHAARDETKGFFS